MTVYVECDPDTVLAETLTSGRVYHQRGKSRVCRVLERQRNCIGVMDEDPFSAQPPLITALGKSGAVQSHTPQGIKVLRDNPNNNILVLLCPRLEEWVLSAAQEASISMDKYHLPSDPKKLHSFLSLSRRRRMDTFRRLLQDLSDTPRIRILRRLLEGGV